MVEADPALALTLQWATRFALPFITTLNIIETAIQAYHAAQWETTEELLTRAAAADPNPFNEHIMRAIRARMLLARGDTKAALKEAALVITYGQASGSDDLLFEGRACEARCHHSLGNDQASLGACGRFLTHWNDGHARIGDLAIALCELTPVLARADRRDDIRHAAQQLPDICRWRDALLLTADGRYADAAALFTDIGSHPLAADSHLLAAHKATIEGRTSDALRHAEAVLAFAAETGAVLYQRPAELLIAAST